MVKNKVSLAKNYHIQPSELENMPYFEYEMLLDEVNENVKSENEANEKQQEQINMSKISTPQMPSMPTFEMPKL